MSPDADPVLSPLLVQLLRDTTDQAEESRHIIRELAESWKSKHDSLERLCLRLEAHDQGLESVIHQWVTHDARSAAAAPVAEGREKNVPPACVKVLRKEPMHATLQDPVPSGIQSPSASDMPGYKTIDDATSSVASRVAKSSALPKVSMMQSAPSCLEGAADELRNSKITRGSKLTRTHSVSEAEHIRARFSTVTNELKKLQTPQPWGFSHFIRSQTFQAVSASMILFHIVVIFVETEYEATTLSGGDSFVYINLTLNCWYALEAALKLMVLRRSFFTGSDRGWNIMDVCLVVLSVIDFVFLMDYGGHHNMAKGVRVVRLARLVRLVRIFRFVGFAFEFQKMMLSLANSLQTLFWSMVLLAFITWAFSVMLTQLVTAAWLEEAPRSDAIIKLRGMFNQVPMGMYHLFQSVTNGVSWGLIGDLLFESDILAGSLFVAYIIFTFFGVLNIATSVFVESALQTTENYKDLLIKEKTRQKATYASHVKAVFESVDADGSGMISAGEMEILFEDECLQEFMGALDVNATDARMLFNLIDHDQSGHISAEEFVDGCLRLKGEAKSFDVWCLIYETERNLSISNRFMKSSQGLLDAMSGKMIEIANLLCQVHDTNEELGEALNIFIPAVSNAPVAAAGAENGTRIRSDSHEVDVDGEANANKLMSDDVSVCSI